MKLIYPKFEIIEQKPGLEGIYEQIELAARICYKSERKEGTTAKDFVDILINRWHLSCLEQGTVYLKIPIDWERYLDDDDYKDLKDSYMNNHYSKVYTDDDYIYMTTNMRVIHEENFYDLLEYLCEPTKYHKKRACVKINCGIDISRELNRHRTLSICEQSTRYCNYSKDKFGNEITCIIPKCLDSNASLNYEISQEFKQALEDSEKHYFNLLKMGWKPENARKVLPLDLATEVVYTAFVSDWKHLFSLRCSDAKKGKPHPDCSNIINKVREEFIKRSYI